MARQMTQEALKYLKAITEAFSPDAGIELDQKAWAKLHAAIKEALAQTQEPVAYIHRNEYNEYRLEPHDNFDIKSIPFNIDVPLFKSPQRTWVDLTDEEIQVVAKQARSKDHAVTLTNKLLREKNT